MQVLGCIAVMTGTAHHEAAHAVAHVALGYRLYEVTINSSVADKLGHTHGSVSPKALKQTKNWSKGTITDKDWQAACENTVVLLVGELAEARFTGNAYCLDPLDPRSSDQVEVLGRLAAMIPADYAAQDALLADLTARARKLVDDNWDGIERVAAELIEAETLDGAAVKAATSEPTASWNGPETDIGGS